MSITRSFVIRYTLRYQKINIKINCLGSKTERACRRKIPRKEGAKNGRKIKSRISKTLGTSVTIWARKSKMIFSPDSWFSKWTPTGWGANIAKGFLEKVV